MSFLREVASSVGFSCLDHQRGLLRICTWQNKLAVMGWPTKKLPEVIEGTASALQAFVRGYLFVLLFQACAESLASENASRLAAMQRAEKNKEYHRRNLGGSKPHLPPCSAGIDRRRAVRRDLRLRSSDEPPTPRLSPEQNCTDSASHRDTP